MIKILKKYWPIFIIVIFVVFYFNNQILNNNFPYSGDFGGSDLLDFNYPMKDIYAESIKDGQMPLWDHGLSSGFPVLAEAQVGSFYPLNLVLYYFLPTLTAFNLSFVLHFLLGALFFYFYAREIKISKFGALFGSLTFMFSAFFVCHMKHVNMINTAIWLPLIFYLTEELFKTKKNIYIPLLGLFLAIQFFAGHAQISYYILLVFSFYFCFKLFFSKINKKEIVKFIFKYILIIFIFFALICVQFFPTFELVGQSYRGEGIDFNDSVVSSFHPRNFLMFLNPYAFGNFAFNSFLPRSFEEQFHIYGLFWEVCGYLGLLGLVFLFFGVLKYCFNKQNRKHILFFLILILISFFFAFGDFNHLFKFFWKYMPFFESFRVTSRFILFVIFSISVIASYGLDYLHNILKKKLGKVSMRIVAVLLLFVLSIDLFSFGYSYNNMNFDSKKWLEKPASVDFLEKDEDLYRVYSFKGFNSWFFINALTMGWQGDQDWYRIGREVISPNNNLIYGIDNPAGYTGIINKKTAELHYVLEKGILSKITGFPKGRFLDINDGFLNILGMQNVKYIVTFYELKNDNLELQKRIRFGNKMLPLQIYENKKVMPRFFLMNKARYLPNEEDILSGLISGQLDPHQEVFLSDGDSNLDESMRQGSIKLKDNQSTHIVLDVSMDGDGFLVINNTYYPGWGVFVNNEKSKILLANYNFQAVKLGKGEHKVEFVYNPKSYKTGKYISLVSFVALFIYFMNYFYRNKKKHGQKN